MKFINVAVIIFFLLGTLGTVSGSWERNIGQVDIQNPFNDHPKHLFQLIPSNYRHRPIIEFFTGLSCPACMSGPHQDFDKLWVENSENPEQPFTFVVFHELNGGGVDDLANDDTKARMQYYQPGVAGTPDAEFDGGYIKLGGLSTNSISYNSASQAVEDCKNRYKRSINPLHPLQSLRNEFKFVELFIDQVFTGEGFAVSVSVRYLGMDTLVSLQNLRASLYVFMIEDNVEAYSKALDENVINHNVFRGYAISDQEFTLDVDETYTTTVEWKIPEITVPIKPGDITAVAAVYDLDDTNSENGNSGNDAQVPRCIQSATPKSTAYDKNNDVPVVSKVELDYHGELKINAELDDANGISKAFVLYTINAENSTSWSFEEMEISGEEVCDDSGVCYAYSDSIATGSIPLETGETIYLIFLVYDGAGVESGGLGAQGKSGLYNYTSFGKSQAGLAGGLFSLEVIGVVIAICFFLFIIIYVVKIRKKK